MNTYDPMEGIVYLRMTRQTDPCCVPVTGTRSINRLPAGYANGSPRTFLGRPRRTPPAA